MSRRGVWTVVVLLGAAGCASTADYSSTPLPTRVTGATSAPAPSAAAACSQRASYDPLAALPAQGAVTDPALREILRRGKLRVGVSADTMLLGARNPRTGTLEGFDIDVAKAVARGIFGSDNKVSFVVVTAAERISALQLGQVDMVARAMTMTCDRWQQVAFSAEYFSASQRLLVSTVSKDTDLDRMEGRPVCVAAGTSAVERVVRSPAKLVESKTDSGCIVKFQDREVDGIVSDDTVLAGIVAQDPYAKVVGGPLSDEPYGLAFKKENVYLVRYVNRVLAQIVADGTWQRLYDRWLKQRLPQPLKPPTPQYGRRTS